MKNSNDIKKLSDNALTVKLEELRSVERTTTLEILHYLIEVEDRKLHLELGYSSMFSFCTEKLGYCESGASRRIRTARCIREHPEVYTMLKNQEVNLSTVSSFSGVLTEANKDEVLGEVKGLSRDKVDMYVARYRPKATPREKIKPIVVRSAPVETTEPSLFEALTKSVSNGLGDRKRDQEESTISETLFDIRFCADEKFMEMFNEVKRTLSGKYPMGVGTEELFKEVMKCFLKQKSPKERQKRRAKRNQKKQVLTSAPKQGLRTVGIVLKDKILKRDDYRCTYQGPGGKRCDCSWNLEIDHIVPWAEGGRTTEENLRTLCSTHNRLLAERQFGRVYAHGG